MVSKAVDLVGKVDEFHVTLIVVGSGAIVELNAAALEVIDSAIDVVGLDCDTAKLNLSWSAIP